MKIIKLYIQCFFIFLIASNISLAQEIILKNENKDKTLVKINANEQKEDDLKNKDYISPYKTRFNSSKFSFLIQVGFGFSDLIITHNFNKNINSFVSDANMGCGLMFKYSNLFHPFLKFIWRGPFYITNNSHNYRKEDFSKKILGMMMFYDFEIGNIFILNSYTSGTAFVCPRRHAPVKECKRATGINSINTFAILGTYQHRKENEYVPLLTDQGAVVGAGIGYLAGFNSLGIEVDLKYKCLIHTKGLVPENIGKVNHMLQLDLNIYVILI